LVAFLAIDNEY